ncbi:glycoside hydrolase family protein [Olivibacter sp. XZL3]|uniref:glycoside hydrolase family protein n=1 Tax=Olivibacter sp. XZL3 TaxID=1735116 RepID=UPI001066F4E5|nr:glycoside hydrolase family protein [Olivibacter sp. XZL3]
MTAVSRKKFIHSVAMSLVALRFQGSQGFCASLENGIQESDFCKKLVPIGRALELPGYYVWCNCPIAGADGKIHVFFSRWKADLGMSGWIKGSEIAHAVAEAPDKPFEVLGTVIAPRGTGFWDGTTCHNPLIKKIGDTYCLFYMGNSNGKTNTKRIGLATASSLQGPWTRTDEPILLPGTEGAWDDHCTTNPAWVSGKDGRNWIYYKSWNTRDYETTTGPIRGNRKYGVAFADTPAGPYEKYEHNPVIDFSDRGANRQFEDAFVWREGDRFKMIARDMGVFNHEVGLIMDSADGLHWSEPQIAFHPLSYYVQEGPAPSHLKRYGRLERPMLLLEHDEPAWLFGASQGGKYQTSSAFIFKCER